MCYVTALPVRKGCRTMIYLWNGKQYTSLVIGCPHETPKMFHIQTSLIPYVKKSYSTVIKHPKQTCNKEHNRSKTRK